MLYLNWIDFNNYTLYIQFNFNKCCIWIVTFTITSPSIGKFNFNKCCIWIVTFTITSPSIGKFNFNKCCIWILILNHHQQYFHYLTLTSVVFECHLLPLVAIYILLFNFNKCCTKKAVTKRISQCYSFFY